MRKAVYSWGVSVHYTSVRVVFGKQIERNGKFYRDFTRLHWNKHFRTKSSVNIVAMSSKDDDNGDDDDDDAQ